MFDEWVDNGDSVSLKPIVLNLGESKKDNITESLNVLSRLYTKPVEFCRKLKDFPPEAQFHIVKTLTYSDKVKEADPGIFPSKY